VAVTASADHAVVDRRRIVLVEPGVAQAPIHGESRRLDVAAPAGLVATVRASVARASSAALDELAAALPAAVRRSRCGSGLPTSPMTSRWCAARPTRRVPTPSCIARSWPSSPTRAAGGVHLYDARAVLDEATGLLGRRAHEILHGPRETLGPPWTKEHRVALAAAIMAADRRSPTRTRAPGQWCGSGSTVVAVTRTLTDPVPAALPLCTRT